MSSAAVPLQERRRADTVAQIKAAAVAQLDELGSQALSLRGVAREVGVSVQALYHYFDSRDALLTALITDAYTALAEAVEAAEAAEAAAAGRGGGVDSTGRSPAGVVAGLAYRQWAVEHRSCFLLTFGAPVQGYSAPQDGPTTAAAQRMGAAFRAAVFHGWSEADLARVPLPEGTDELRRQLAAVPESHGVGLPPGALALFTEGWALLHGLVVLEVLGHAPWLAGAEEPTLRAALTRYAATVDAARTS